MRKKIDLDMSHMVDCPRAGHVGEPIAGGLVSQAGKQGHEIHLTGGIFMEKIWGNEVTPEDVTQALQQANGADITLCLNSGGGSVWAGVQIFNVLQNYSGRVIVRIDALAASIATIIALAGDELHISQAGLMMFHRASTSIWGNGDAMLEAASLLEKIDAAMIDIIMSRTGMGEEDVHALIGSGDTFLSAEECLAKNLVSKIIKIEKREDAQTAASLKAQNIAALAAQGIHIPQNLTAQPAPCKSAPSAADKKADQPEPVADNAALYLAAAKLRLAANLT